MRYAANSNHKIDLNLEQIESKLKTVYLGKSSQVNELWQSIDSTNNRAIELAHTGVSAGAIIIANQQTAGRGRSGNAWLSPAGSGLYMSFIVQSKFEAEYLPVITLATGVAVVRAIQICSGIKVGLKWVNDLIVEGRKIGGILAEYISRPNNEPALIIGIGLNLTKPKSGIPQDLAEKIGFLDSFFKDAEHRSDKNQLVAFIANELETILDEMQRDLELILDQWRAYSVTLGKEIVALVGNEKIIGEALDITNSGKLIVKTISGNIELSAGEVSIRNMDGKYT